jgi:ABC-2 type transport system permease protein
MKALAGQIRAELILFLRDKTILFFSIFFPLATVVFFGYLNRTGQVGSVSYPSFLIAGGIGMVVASAAFENLSTMLARQRAVGVLKRLGGTPLRIWTLIAAKVLAAALVILVQALVMAAANVLLFQAKIPGNVLWGLATLVVGILAFATMGVALAGLCRNADIASAAGMAIALPMQFLGGTIFPLEEMPPLLRHIAHALPLTYMVDALRGALLTGGGPAAYPIDWLVLLGSLAIAFAVAVKTFSWE